MVLAAHVLHETKTPHVEAWWMAPIERGGLGGVILFFALSGFLLYLPWLRSSLEQRPRPSFKTYALRRCLRIMPAYYASVTAFAVLRVLVGGREPITASAIALHFVFLPTLGNSLQTVYWTLQVEEFFYWLLPGIHRVIARTGITLTFVAAAAVSALWCAAAFALVDAHNRQLWLEQMPLFLPGFVLGIYCAIRWKSPPRFCGRALLWGGIAFYAVAAPPLASIARSDEVLHPLTGLCMAPAACAAVLGAARGGARILEHPVLRFLGGISFSVYLWHIAVIRLVPCPSAIAHLFVPRLLWTIAITIPVALVAYLVVERPFLLLRPQMRQSAS